MSIHHGVGSPQHEGYCCAQGSSCSRPDKPSSIGDRIFHMSCGRSLHPFKYGTRIPGNPLLSLRRDSFWIAYPQPFLLPPVPSQASCFRHKSFPRAKRYRMKHRFFACTCHNLSNECSHCQRIDHNCNPHGGRAGIVLRWFSIRLAGGGCTCI